MGKPLRQAILDGAMQIAGPTFVSTLTICIVFVSVLFLDGPAQVPVHAAGAGRGVRDAGVVPAVADAGAGDGRLPAAGRSRGPRTRQRAAGLLRPAARRRSSAASSSSATAYVDAAGLEPAASPSRVRRLRASWSSSGLALLPFVGADFFPTRRCRPVPPARPRPGRHAARGDRALLQPGRSGDSPRSFPADEVELIIDNIGLPNRSYSHGLRRQRHDRHGRRRDPGRAEASPLASRRRSTWPSCAASCRSGFRS